MSCLRNFPLICFCTELGYILKLKKVGTAPKPDREIEDIGNAGTCIYMTSHIPCLV